MVNKDAGMTIITKTVTRLTVGLIFIYGLYVVSKARLGPGGGFAGGIIISLSFIHIMLAFGRDKALAKLDKVRGLFLCSLGAFVFLCLAAWGIQQSRMNHAIIESLGDIAVALMVGTGLFIVFLALVSFVGGALKK